MKNKMLNMLLVLTVILALAPSSFAQTATVQTVLSAAVTSLTSTAFQVVSATGITGPTTAPFGYVFVDNELARVVSVSGTTLTVARTGAMGSHVSTHLTGAPVYWGLDGASPFVTRDPKYGVTTGSGQCTAANYRFLPIINVQNGNIWQCDSTTTRWGLVNLSPMTAMAFKRKPVSDAAVTLTLADIGVVAYTTISAARTVTLPAITNIDGVWFIITEENSNLQAAQTITVTGVNGQLIGPGSLTNATITTNGGTLRLYSANSLWHTW